mmetsp:Transcript_11157/g.15709  ORF Transcript_11157/g.15709 Transcript_11157/m.15709 type:complete len:483 (+) Transcript_11157:27-1475(+)
MTANERFYFVKVTTLIPSLASIFLTMALSMSFTNVFSNLRLPTMGAMAFNTYYSASSSSSSSSWILRHIHKEPTAWRRFTSPYSYSQRKHSNIMKHYDSSTRNGDENREIPRQAPESVKYGRRSLLMQGWKTMAVCGASSSFTFISNANPCNAATRAKGAAEYDLEYYLRDAFRGNKKEGNLPASNAPPSPPSRTMGGISNDSSPSTRDFLFSILNDACDDTCIPVREISKLLSDSGITTEEISKRIREERVKVSKAFYSKSPWKHESISDQYYFDLTSYALYRVAAELMPTNYILRDKWVRNVGKALYFQAINNGLLLPLTSTSSDNQLRDHPLTATIPNVIQLLDVFQSIGLISSYRLGEESKGNANKDEMLDIRNGINVFDSYDDDDLLSGSNVNCLVSLFRPATLNASLQITGEGSRFAPDFVGPTLTALWEDVIGSIGTQKVSKVEYESYFVDPEYRPNPKDFFPDEQLLQYTIRYK